MTPVMRMVFQTISTQARSCAVEGAAIGSFLGVLEAALQGVGQSAGIVDLRSHVAPEPFGPLGVEEARLFEALRVVEENDRAVESEIVKRHARRVRRDFRS